MEPTMNKTEPCSKTIGKNEGVHIETITLNLKGVLNLIRKVEIAGVNTAKLPVLSNKEKQELLVKIKNRDNEAREKFIQGNLRLVLSVIQRFTRTWRKHG